MEAEQGGKKIDRKQLEAWLAQVLVPVEPNPLFLRRLRARLVTYHGGGLFSGWMMVVVLATALLLVITTLGLLLRFLLGWFNLIGLIGRKKRRSADPQTITVSTN